MIYFKFLFIYKEILAEFGTVHILSMENMKH